VWFAERWHVALQPGALTVVQRGRGARGGAPEHAECLPCPQAAPGDAAWAPVLQALASWLAGRPRPPRVLHAVLSGHFVRWQLLPWSDALVRPDELAAYAALRLREVYGAAADAWQVAYAAPAPGQAVAACGVDAALLARLRAVCAARGTRLQSVTPYAAAAFGHWRRALGRQTTYFGVLEPGLLLLGLQRGGQWRSLRSERVPASGPRLAEALRRMQGQQALAAGLDERGLPLYLAGVQHGTHHGAQEAVQERGVHAPALDGTAPASTWLAPRWPVAAASVPPAARMALGV